MITRNGGFKRENWGKDTTNHEKCIFHAIDRFTNPRYDAWVCVNGHHWLHQWRWSEVQSMWCWVHLWLWSAPCAMVWLECQVQLLRPQSCRLGSSVKRPSGIQPMVSCKGFFGSHVFRTSTVVLTFHAWKKHRQVASPASKTLIFYNRCLEHLNLDFADGALRCVKKSHVDLISKKNEHEPDKSRFFI